MGCKSGSEGRLQDEMVPAKGLTDGIETSANQSGRRSCFYRGREVVVKLGAKVGSDFFEDFGRKREKGHREI
jgi:hypothetical protein